MNRSLDVVARGEAVLEFNRPRPGEPRSLQGSGAEAPLPRAEQVEALP